MTKTKQILASTLICLLNPAIVLAHGEDVAGPHGGHIRMPGAFHTELTQQSSNSFMVYLLDINFKNPTIKNSAVNVTANLANSKIEISKCLPDKLKNNFVCTLKSDLKATKLTVIANREGAQGNDAIYNLPLKALPKATQGTSAPAPSHHSH